MLETILLAASEKIIHDEKLQNELLAWFKSKKFKPGDFAFLNILQTNTQKLAVANSLLKCQKFNASFTETQHALELVTELVMMNIELPIDSADTHLTQWMATLKALRYPYMTFSDQDLKSKLEALPWPYGAKVKFERRGDRAGIELKLFITSAADLTKSISALERVKDQL